MMKNIACGVIGLIAITGSAQGQVTSTAFATGWATVQPAGPRTGTAGQRFLNVQGSDSGTFASYAPVRWDISSIRADFDTAFGSGNWVVESIELDLWASNAAFTLPGNVVVYFSPDDTTNLTPGASDTSLFFDPSFGAGGNSGTTGVNGGFDRGSEIATFNFPFFGSGSNGPLPRITLALNTDIVDDVQNDSNLSIVMEAFDTFVAATLKGDSFGGLEPPRIVITASGSSTPVECLGDIADDFGFTAVDGGGPDGVVDFGDFVALLGLIGECPGGVPGCLGDIADDFGFTALDGGGPDGVVDFGDFVALLGLIGPCPQ